MGGPEVAVQLESIYTIYGRTKSGKETGLDTIILINLGIAQRERHSLIWKFVALINKNLLPGEKGVDNSQ